MWPKPHERPTGICHRSSGRGQFPTDLDRLFKKLTSLPFFMLNFLANEFFSPVVARLKNIIGLSQDIHEHTHAHTCAHAASESSFHTPLGVEKAYSGAALVRETKADGGKDADEGE